MIKRLIIKNYKGIRNADILLNNDKNIIVGNNGVGKSTIIEALTLALGYGLSQLEVVQSLFNVRAVAQFKKDKIPPTILIEVYFDENNADFSGKNNSLHQNEFGIQLKIKFDEDTYQDLFNAEKGSCTQIPCEYYIVDRYWFSDKKVIQRLIPYYIQVVDSTSNFFNSSSNQYIAHLVQKYLSDDENTRIKTSLRKLKDDFEENDQLKSINKAIAKKNPDMKVSIDVSSNIITRNIICPLVKDIPVEQIGAGDLCILKTILSLDKSNQTDKPKIIIIEEPESHLSHTKMYELLRQIEEKTNSGDTQIIITTHNNFIANKLNLDKLILINNDDSFHIEVQTFNDKKTAAYFTKVSNYPTLRLILCKTAILVEGPTDEMVVTYYYNQHYGHHPFDDGIELISVDGVRFRAYAQLAKGFSKKIAILTDNDGMIYDELLRKRGLDNLPDNIKVFTDVNIERNYTLEPSFVSKNEKKIQKLSDIVRGNTVKNDNCEDLVAYMTEDSNKTLWSYRLLSNVYSTDFEAPDYIVDAINWLKDE